MFVRMAITLVLGTLYMWWAKVEHFPLGSKDVRILLMVRGFGGFFGRECPSTVAAVKFAIG